MKIIIPMSGIGKRFVEAGYSDPKPLILVEGKPIIQHVIELFPGETDITFICNDLHLRETNMKEILLNIVPTCKIIEVSVENRRGPVDAVLQAIQLLSDKSMFFENENEEVIVSYCDYGTQWDYSSFLKNMRENNMDGGIACYIGFHPHMLGSDNYAFLSVIDNDSGSACIEMTAIQEKQPFTDNKMNEYASNGTYYFRNGNIMKIYFERLMYRNICVNNEFYVSMVYNLMREDNLRIGVFKIDKMLQWGTPKDLEEYLVWSNYFLKREQSFNYVDVDVDVDKIHDVTLILPMAGAGSRFFNVGYSTPKPLLDVEGLPMVVQAVKCLPPTHKKIFICQKSHLEEYPIAETLLNSFNEDDVSVIDIGYITEGQACTCELAFNNTVGENNVQIPDDKPVMISACDNGVYYDMQKYLDVWLDTAVDIIIWSFSNNPTSLLYPHMYAWLDVDESGFIKRVSIKKPFTDCDAKHCIIGTMLFKKARYFKEGLDLIYSGNLRTNGEFYVDNMIEPLVEKGYRCKIFDVTNYLCWGTPNDYKTYQYWHEYFCKHP